MRTVTIWGLLTAALVASGFTGHKAEAISVNSVAPSARSTALTRLLNGLPPVPTKTPDATLASWLQTVNRQQLDPTAVQQRVPTEALIAWLKTAWQREADPSEVLRALEAAGWQFGINDFQAVDVTGDGRPEWLLTVSLDPNDVPWGRSGDFWIIGEDVLYRFFQPSDYFRERTEADAVPLDQDFYLSAPQVVGTPDMTGDGTADVLLRRQMCGAHTCTQAYFVLSNQAGEIQQVVSPQKRDLDNSGQAIILYYSDLESLTDETGDGVADLVLHAGAIASAGAGYQRTRTEIWAWNGETVSLAQTQLDPTNYRHLILYEANDYFAKGNLDQARTLYQQVVEDDSLEDVQWSEEFPSSHDSTVQFAAFRLALLGLMESDQEAAGQWQGWLQRQYPSAPITKAAQLLQSADQTSLETACAAARDYLVSLENPDDDFPGKGPTGPLRYMGYANPSLQAADVCPAQ
ncbi:MAG TPA: hypothetical protein V6D29_01270 [Leptolyngbyaceae cyanobacterium]